MQVLRLGGCNLTGTIPTDLGVGTSLRELYLDQNKYLGGTISPAWVDTLPDSPRVLNVYLDDLTGTLPANWHLPRLITMWLAMNRLTGTSWVSFCTFGRSSAQACVCRLSVSITVNS